MTTAIIVASRGAIPSEAVPYRTVGPFGAQSLPAGLRAEHRLKEGTWGLLDLAEGALRFVWDDEEGGAEELVAPASLVVPPEVLHHVEGEGPFAVTIAFHRV